MTENWPSRSCSLPAGGSQRAPRWEGSLPAVEPNRANQRDPSRYMRRHRSAVSLLVAAAASAAHGSAAAVTPYHLLRPLDYRSILGADYSWAVQNIPMFESANRTLDLVYYFRWRTYRSHIHPTNEAATPWVVTEFAPKVGCELRSAACQCRLCWALLGPARAGASDRR